MFKFQGNLYRNAYEMHNDIARTWVTGGGDNGDEFVVEVLSGSSEAIALEAERSWNLDQVEGYSRAEIINAIDEMRTEAGVER